MFLALLFRTKTVTLGLLSRHGLYFSTQSFTSLVTGFSLATFPLLFLATVRQSDFRSQTAKTWQSKGAVVDDMAMTAKSCSRPGLSKQREIFIVCHRSENYSIFLYGSGNLSLITEPLIFSLGGMQTFTRLCVMSSNMSMTVLQILPISPPPSPPHPLFVLFYVTHES